jgi:polyferredoxin
VRGGVPTGIDIREGAQIGCITCGLCIDACDRVMGQVGRERGLIDYCTLDDAEHERKGGAPKSLVKAIFRPRTLVYLGLWSAIGLGLLFMLGQRTRLDLSVARDRNPNSCNCPTDRCAMASRSSCATWKTARATRCCRSKGWPAG